MTERQSLGLNIRSLFFLSFEPLGRPLPVTRFFLSLDPLGRPDPGLRFFLSLDPFGRPDPGLRFFLSPDPAGRPLPGFRSLLSPMLCRNAMASFSILVCSYIQTMTSPPVQRIHDFFSLTPRLRTKVISSRKGSALVFCGRITEHRNTAARSL